MSCCRDDLSESLIRRGFPAVVAVARATRSFTAGVVPLE